LLRRLAPPIILGIALTLASTINAREFNWPDYYHIEYGFPLAWLLRTLSTIRGPTDTLEFQITPFVLDLIFWSVVGAILLFVANRLRRM
jgi:hypothetical protein